MMTRRTVMMTPFFVTLLALGGGCPDSDGGGAYDGYSETASLRVNNDTSLTANDLIACVAGTFDDTSSVQNAMDNGQCRTINVPAPTQAVLFELGTSPGVSGWDPGEDLRLFITWPTTGGGQTCARYTLWEMDTVMAYFLNLSAVPTPEQAITDNTGSCRQYIEGTGGADLCTDTCGPENNGDGTYAGDGACDDGGPEAEYDVCTYGTDCTDCGPRPPQ